MATVALHEVSKDFVGRRGRSVRAVDRLTLDIPAKEWLAVLGPSGSGKTTLLRLIAGLDSATSGQVLVDGRPATSSEGPSLELAFVFQRDALLPHLTARENIALGLRLRGHGRDEIESRLREADEFLRLGDALDRFPRALSGGERQRAALARAFVRRPRVLLLDEPLSGLDAPLRAELRVQLRELHRRLGATVVHVTHDQSEALALGGRIAVMRQGALQQLADPRSLYLRPANAFVAGFIGAPPMNLFRGRLMRESGSLWLHLGSDDGLSLCLTEEQSSALEKLGLAGREIVLGLRPEHIFNPEEGRVAPFGCEVTADLEAVELQGPDAQLQWSCGQSRFTSRGRNSVSARVGSAQPLIFDLAEAHFFDGKSGSALTW